jgi:L-2-hydroxyglutarate oxidase LhgO
VYDAAVVGGGIVGLAIAREFGGDVVVLEKEPAVARHQTGRNSGVIHSGVYYRPGSLKARLCVEGAALMKRFCIDRGLPLLECGKVIVATREEELPRLDELLRRARANGVPDVEMVGRERLREIEPHVAGIRALWLPRVCVTDYAAVARSIASELRVLTGVRATRLAGRRLETTAGPIEARRFIFCAGLHSDRLAHPRDLRIVPFRGEYWMLKPEREHLVRGLIYPVPNPALPFLGVHFGRRVQGGVKAGPNAVLALKREGYSWREASLAELLRTAGYGGFWRMAIRHARIGIDEVLRSLIKRRFVRSLQRLVPEVREEDLLPGGSGVRAQAVETSGALVDDFRLVQRGNALHVLNAPSPAATASLAIARYVCR